MTEYSEPSQAYGALYSIMRENDVKSSLILTCPPEHSVVEE